MSSMTLLLSRRLLLSGSKSSRQAGTDSSTISGRQLVGAAREPPSGRVLTLYGTDSSTPGS